MNKEYTYKDGNIIIDNENGKQKVIEYQDNIDEILVKENIIETMEDKIQTLEEECTLYKNDNLPTSLKVLLSGIFLTFCLVFPMAVGNYIGVFSSLNFYSITAMVISGVIGVSFLGVEYLIDKLYTKEEKGRQNQLQILRQDIKKEKNELQKLKECKTKDKEKAQAVTNITIVNDTKEIDSLNSYLNAYYDLGYNDKKYSKYYKNGTLEEKLSSKYNEEEIDLVKNYIEENSPKLVKTLGSKIKK